MLRVVAPFKDHVYEVNTDWFNFSYTSSTWLDSCEAGFALSDLRAHIMIEKLVNASGTELFPPFTYLYSKSNDAS